MPEAVVVPNKLECGNCLTVLTLAGRVLQCPVCKGELCPLCSKSPMEGTGDTVFCPSCDNLLDLPPYRPHQ